MPHKPHFIQSDKRAIIVLAVAAIFLVGIRLGMSFGKDHESAQQSCEQGAASTSSDSLLSHLAAEPFDPNTVDSLTLIAHGLTPYQAKSLIHYRNSGAVFRTASELSRLYGWDASDVERLGTYIQIDPKFNKSSNPSYRKHNYHADTERHTNGYVDSHSPTHYQAVHADTPYVAKYPSSNKFTTPTRIDINTADSATLIRIPGMGEKSVNAVLSLRKRMGGFVSTEQILDIRFINPQVLQWLKVSDTPPIRHIHINIDDFRTINAHPYITYEQTKDIVNCRRLNGNFDSADALLSTQIFTPEQLSRLLPYLSFDVKRQ